MADPSQPPQPVERKFVEEPGVAGQPQWAGPPHILDPGAHAVVFIDPVFVVYTARGSGLWGTDSLLKRRHFGGEQRFARRAKGGPLALCMGPEETGEGEQHQQLGAWRGPAGQTQEHGQASDCGQGQGGPPQKLQLSDCAPAR